MYNTAELAALLKTSISHIRKFIAKHNIQHAYRGSDNYKLYRYDEIIAAFRQGIE